MSCRRITRSSALSRGGMVPAQRDGRARRAASQAAAMRTRRAATKKRGLTLSEAEIADRAEAFARKAGYETLDAYPAAAAQ